MRPGLEPDFPLCISDKKTNCPTAHPPSPPATQPPSHPPPNHVEAIVPRASPPSAARDAATAGSATTRKRARAGERWAADEGGDNKGGGGDMGRGRRQWRGSGGSRCAKGYRHHLDLTAVLQRDCYGIEVGKQQVGVSFLLRSKIRLGIPSKTCVRSHLCSSAFFSSTRPPVLKNMWRAYGVV